MLEFKGQAVKQVLLSDKLNLLSSLASMTTANQTMAIS